MFVLLSSFTEKKAASLFSCHLCTNFTQLEWNVSVGTNRANRFSCWAAADSLALELNSWEIKNKLLLKQSDDKKVIQLFVVLFLPLSTRRKRKKIFSFRSKLKSRKLNLHTTTTIDENSLAHSHDMTNEKVCPKVWVSRMLLQERVRGAVMCVFGGFTRQAITIYLHTMSAACRSKTIASTPQTLQIMMMREWIMLSEEKWRIY